MYIYVCRKFFIIFFLNCFDRVSLLNDLIYARNVVITAILEFRKDC